MFSFFRGKPTPTSTPNVQNSKPKIVSLIFSHNSRMQCFMERFKISENKEKIRFKNGAIIKLVVENGEITPSLVHEGELDEKETKKIVEKGAYYTKNETTKNSNVTNLTNKLKKNIIEKLKKESTSVSTQNGNTVIIPKKYNENAKKILNKNLLSKKINLNERFKIFNNYFEPKNLSILKYLTKEKTIDIDPNQTYEFYIIRHGQGIHNGVHWFTKAKEGKYKDATLTDIGKEQAGRSGEALNEILGSGDKVNYLFATDLRRTRETLVEVLGKLTNQQNLKNPNIIILPCSHEISVEKDKILNLGVKINRSCDALEAWSTSKAAKENFPVCTKAIINTKNNNNECVKKGGYPIDWSYYLAFYNNSMRGERASARLHCRNTNMIIEALNIIKNGTNVIEQYKKNILQRKNIINIMNNRGIKLQKSVGKTVKSKNTAHYLRDVTKKLKNQQKKSIFSGMFGTQKK